MRQRALERLERLCTVAPLAGMLARITLVRADPARAVTALALAAL